MKIVLTFNEARGIILEHFKKHWSEHATSVTFIHQCPDGSGELELTQIAEVSRVEVSVEGLP